MESEKFLIIELCSNCDETFDLSYDLENIRNEVCKEPIKELLENCGVKDLLCWYCRACKDENQHEFT